MASCITFMAATKATRITARSQRTDRHGSHTNVLTIASNIFSVLTSPRHRVTTDIFATVLSYHTTAHTSTSIQLHPLTPRHAFETPQTSNTCRLQQHKQLRTTNPNHALAFPSQTNQRHNNVSPLPATSDGRTSERANEPDRTEPNERTNERTNNERANERTNERTNNEEQRMSPHHVHCHFQRYLPTLSSHCSLYPTVHTFS